jgi:chaperonin cofactor prefoldin
MFCDAYDNLTVELLRVRKDVNSRLEKVENKIHGIEQNIDNHNKEINVLKKLLI